MNGWIKDLNIGLFNVPLSNTTYGTEYGSQDVVMTNQFGPDGGFNIIGNMLSNTHIAGGITFPTQATYNGSTPTHQMIAGFYTVVWSNSFSATDSITLPSNPGNDGQLYMIINKSATYPLKIYGNFPSGVVALSINIYRCISLIYSYPLNMWFPLGAFT